LYLSSLDALTADLAVTDGFQDMETFRNAIKTYYLDIQDEETVTVVRFAVSEAGRLA
jgi:hypothetical protein